MERIKTIAVIIILIGLSAITASAQPAITGVSNAASQSFSLEGPQDDWLTLPNGSIAQGSYFTIYGNGLAAALSTCGNNYVNCVWPPKYPLPLSVQDTSVSLTIGSSQPVAAYVEFAAQLSSSLAQVNAVLPSNTPVGAGTVTVTYNGATSAPVPINVVASSFGTFTWTTAGSGPGVMINAVTYADITPFTPAKPGDYVVVYGTGLGPATNPTTEQTQAPSLVNLCAAGQTCPVTVYVGGAKANIYYAGSAGYTAEDEVIFIVPTGLQGCYMPVAIVSGGVTSNVTTIPIDPNGAPCTDADGVGMSYFNSLVASKGYADVGVIGLSSQLWNIDFDGVGDFEQWLYDSVDARIGKFPPAALNYFEGFTQAPSSGTAGNCVSTSYLGYPPPSDPGLNFVTYLDAGPQLTIQSPASGVMPQTVPQAADPGPYDGLVGGITALPTGNILDYQQWIPPFFWLSTANSDMTYNVNGLASGTYVVTGVGGKDVGAFTGMLDVSSAAATFQWTNSSVFADPNGTPTLLRTTPLTVTWSGGDPQGFMDIRLIGSTVTFTVPSGVEPATQVECVVPANLGTFTVPTYMLATLPVSDTGPLAAGMVLLGPISAPQKISPPPTGLDALYMYYRFLSGYTVFWQ